MKNVFRSLIFIFILSCSIKAPYSNQVQTKYKLTDNDVKRLQFYLRGEIYLQTLETESNTGTKNGELVINSSSNRNGIIITNNTKGVAEVVGDNFLEISFEQEGKTLKFVKSEIDGKYRLQTIKSGQYSSVIYNSTKYYVDERSKAAFLFFKMKKNTSNKVNNDKLGGRDIR